MSPSDAAKPIAFIDLVAQRRRLGSRIDDAVAKVIAGGQYILGPEVTELERRLAEFTGARHAITCANGTDAIQLVLMALSIGAGDAVFVPGFTFVATAEVVALAGATPVFVDVDRESFNIDAASLEAAIPVAKARGLKPRAIIAVDLYGQPADYPRLHDIAAANGLELIADGAQSFGAALDGRRVGTLTRTTTTSFYPAKPLGCYGDGGAMFTDDDRVAELLMSLRYHGKGGHQYENVRVGMNSRLDTLQAAILIPKLEIFADEIEARQRVAGRYESGLADFVATPQVRSGALSAWAQYTLVVEDRDTLVASCKAAGVPTAIHYPVPLHKQKGYSAFPVTATGMATCEWLAARVVSLPMHPYLDAPTQDRIIGAIRDAVRPPMAKAAARR
ncbi:MAG: DegT/DnrJ/EryC1/StrS family aminotransferase [Hyphomicrobium sp.]